MFFLLLIFENSSVFGGFDFRWSVWGFWFPTPFVLFFFSVFRFLEKIWLNEKYKEISQLGLSPTQNFQENQFRLLEI